VGGLKLKNTLKDSHDNDNGWRLVLNLFSTLVLTIISTRLIYKT